VIQVVQCRLRTQNNLSSLSRLQPNTELRLVPDGISFLVHNPIPGTLTDFHVKVPDKSGQDHPDFGVCKTMGVLALNITIGAYHVDALLANTITWPGGEGLDSV
jgi:hypothetical protein